jgi:hypothetical protein
VDPDANLAEQKRIAARVLRGDPCDGDLERAADLVEALDEWLVKGGFLPARWRHE